MEKEFVPYELALRLKVLGFDEECFYVKPLKEKTEFFYTPSDYYDFPEQKELEVGMPLYQQAFRWFDYSTEWSGFVVPSREEGCFDWWIQNYTDHQLSIESDEWYRGREEAELACLQKLIEIVESK
jgi:hypothetical protein